MRSVTTGAALGFHGHMLVHERSPFFGVAFHANGVARRDRSHLTNGCGPVHVVAVGAEQETFVNAVVIGSGEISLRRHVAAVAKIRLRLCQQMIWLFGVVRRVAIQAANIVAGMRRRREVPLLQSLPMTTQATRARLLCRESRKTDDLGDVPSAFHVL